MTVDSMKEAGTDELVEVSDQIQNTAGQRISEPRWTRLTERFGLVIALLVVVGVFSIWLPTTFPTFGNLQTILSSQTVLLILSLSLVVSFSANEFDLSIGAVMALTSAVTCDLTSNYGWNIWPALLLSLAIGIFIGAFNAFLVVKIGISSIVATLGTGTLLAGLQIKFTGSAPISFGATGFQNFMTDHLLGLPVIWYLAVVGAALLYYVLEQTPLGRYVRFVGASHDVARLAGIRVAQIRAGALIGASLLATLAGVALICLEGSSDPTSGTTLLLPAFAGAFLGATSIRPGKFNVVGTFVAVYFLVTGITGLQLAGLQSWVEQVFYGASLIVAVAIAQVRAGKDVARG
jgi:ribose transport system permease protein